tara:strand:- start:11673 stop:12353 length:681 start_codon:yes stop_codon:yes gene_type:complete
MLLQKNKKIWVYFFLFIFCGTFSNKYLNNFNLPKIKKIEVLGLEGINKIKLSEELNFLKQQNLLILDKDEIKKILDSNYLIEKYFIVKEYPSSLKFKITKTKFLANISMDNKLFFLGSNRKLIRTQKSLENIPFIFGDFNDIEFFKLKSIIDDNSLLDYKEIKSLFFFPSGRWDFETYSDQLIKLPKVNIKESLKLYSKIKKDDTFSNAKVIDLRQINQLVINEQR